VKASLSLLIQLCSIHLESTQLFTLSPVAVVAGPAARRNGLEQQGGWLVYNGRKKEELFKEYAM